MKEQEEIDEDNMASSHAEHLDPKAKAEALKQWEKDIKTVEINQNNNKQ